MNIDIVEMEGYEADDVIGTLSRYGESKGLDVIILSGDRDNFQLATDKVTIRIPHTKAGKTETDEYNREKIIEKYGLDPRQLIDVKGLQGDASDNIPGVPGIGEKTALALIQKFGSIEKLYEQVEKEEDGLKGKQREKIVNNKDLAFLSKTLGTINLEVPIEDKLEDFKVEPWDKEKVLNIFKELNFNRYIDRFNLRGEGNSTIDKQEENKLEYEEIEISLEDLLEKIKNSKQMTMYISTKKDDENEYKIIKEKISGISIYLEEKNKVVYFNFKEENEVLKLKEFFEDGEIKKTSINLNKIYILLKQLGITLKGIEYDISIAAYILNPTNNKLEMNNLINDYLEIDIEEYLGNKEEKDNQINLFDQIGSNDQELEKQEYEIEKKKSNINVVAIKNIKEITKEKLENINATKLFNEIDMPTVEVLANMQWNGMYVDEKELSEFGKELTDKLEVITKIIYEMAGEEFNINSTKQLGEILFEKMK